jgi:acyl-CoA thioesterase FadM
MNLYLRLLWTLLRARRMPALSLGDALEREFRVLPNDLDLNGHMNNGRYLTMLDLMLVEYFVRAGFAAVMLRQGWRPMAGGSFISYRRGLKPLQRYQLRFRLEAADERWNYMRFEFHDGRQVCATGYVKGSSVSRQGLVPNAQSYAALGVAPPAAPLPAAVRNWLAAEQAAVASAW